MHTARAGTAHVAWFQHARSEFHRTSMRHCIAQSQPAQVSSSNPAFVHLGESSSSDHDCPWLTVPEECSARYLSAVIFARPTVRGSYTKLWSPQKGFNLRPQPYKGCALSTELCGQNCEMLLYRGISSRCNLIWLVATESAEQIR